MELKGQELRELYEAVIRPFEHPDPLGYVTRAVLTSGGDPDFVGDDTKLGFMPVDPAQSNRLVGVVNVQDLQNNIIATLSMDRLFFDKFQSVDDMVLAFHFNEENVNQEQHTPEQVSFLNDIDDNSDLVYQLMYPPLATIDNVMELLTENAQTNITKEERKFFNLLLEQQG